MAEDTRRQEGTNNISVQLPQSMIEGKMKQNTLKFSQAETFGLILLSPCILTDICYFAVNNSG